MFLFRSLATFAGAGSTVKNNKRTCDLANGDASSRWCATVQAMVALARNAIWPDRPSVVGGDLVLDSIGSSALADLYARTPLAGC